MTTALQIRAACALIGMSQADLPNRVQVSTETIKRSEGLGKPSASADAIDVTLSALEAAGVHFIAKNGGRPDVCLKRRRK